jgi:hypothetical protein
MTYGAIGKTLNVSRERVRQMVAAGLRERQREEQAAATNSAGRFPHGDRLSVRARNCLWGEGIDTHEKLMEADDKPELRQALP